MKPLKFKMRKHKNAKGTLNVAKDGGVYFTDTSGSGKRRAEVMEKLDKWIDEHGGTPEPPKTSGSRTGGGVTSGDIPAGYSLTKAIDSSSYITSSYPWGNALGLFGIEDENSELLLIHTWETVGIGNTNQVIRPLEHQPSIQQSAFHLVKAVLIRIMDTSPLWSKSSLTVQY